MTNVDGVAADGVVGVLLEQLTVNAARMKTDAFANTAVVDCRNSRALDCVTCSWQLYALLTTLFAAGLYVPAGVRDATAMRFHALIVVAMNVRSKTSFSLKCRRVSS